MTTTTDPLVELTTRMREAEQVPSLLVHEARARFGSDGFDPVVFVDMVVEDPPLARRDVGVGGDEAA